MTAVHMDATMADFFTGLIQFGSIILLCFVFYAVLQVVRVVQEEFAEKQEQRFDRWYKERILHPKHPPPKE